MSIRRDGRSESLIIEIPKVLRTTFRNRQAAVMISSTTPSVVDSLHLAPESRDAALDALRLLAVLCIALILGLGVRQAPSAPPRAANLLGVFPDFDCASNGDRCR